MGLPCSEVSSAARSFARSSIRAAAPARMWARFSVSVAAHSGKARFAVSTAASTSATSPAGTLATTSSVGGVRTSISSCEGGVRHPPPISIAASTISPLSLSARRRARSRSLEVRFAALARGGESLAMILRLQERRLGEALDDLAAAQVDVRRDLEQALGGGVRERRAAEHPADAGARGVEQALRARRDLGQQPRGASGLGVVVLAPEHDLLRTREAEQLDEAGHAAVRGDEADAALAEEDARGRRADPPVARQRQRDPRPRDRAVDGRDDRLLEAPEGPDEVGQAVRD